MQVTFGHGETQVAPEPQRGTVDLPVTEQVRDGATLNSPGETFKQGGDNADASAAFKQRGDLDNADASAAFKRSTTALVAPSRMLPGDEIPDMDQVILPGLNIVQGVGGLKDYFPQGALIYDQKTLLYSPTVMHPQTGEVVQAGLPPVKVSVLGFTRRRYAEQIAGGERGRMFDSPEDVVKAGGTLDWKEWRLAHDDGVDLFRAQPYVKAFMAIFRPAHVRDDDSIFSIKVENEKLAFAWWSLKGAAYTSAGMKVLFRARKLGCLMEKGYPSWTWLLSTRLEKWTGGHSAQVPVLVADSRTSDVFQEFAHAALES